MAEASVFIGLTASVDPSLQAIALSGLFQAANIGVITGLAASSAVLQVALQRKLEEHLVGFDNKDKVSSSLAICYSDVDLLFRLLAKLYRILATC